MSQLNTRMTVAKAKTMISDLESSKEFFDNHIERLQKEVDNAKRVALAVENKTRANIDAKLNAYNRTQEDYMSIKIKMDMGIMRRSIIEGQIAILQKFIDDQASSTQ